MNNRNLKLIILDACAAALVLFISFLLRFEFSIPSEYKSIYFTWLPWFMSSQVIVFYFSGLYARIWRYTSLWELITIIKYVTIGFLEVGLSSFNGII